MIQSYAGVPALFSSFTSYGGNIGRLLGDRDAALGEPDAALGEPDGPIVAVRPHVIAARARAVTTRFPGDVLYAVKCNDDPLILDALYEGGVRQFDTASINEIRLIRERYPEAECHFMHPVKTARAIAEAYFVHEVRRFVVDHEGELDKLIEATGGARDLEIFVRVAVPGDGAVLSLTGKFGATPLEALDLLERAGPHARRLGLTFHVGSQCLTPVAFERAIAIAADIATRAGGIDDLDVGGGFPARYTGDEPEFEAFAAAIERCVRRHRLTCRLQCEPGRLLVADGVSVLARVDLRRGNRLYLNDGVYGHLAELKWVGPQFPTRAVAGDGSGTRQAPETAFDFYGPTCDSIDSMPGPHWLAQDTAGGDWIEVGMMGAYSSALRTRFNGFSARHQAIIDDVPWYLEGAMAERTKRGELEGLEEDEELPLALAA